MWVRQRIMAGRSASRASRRARSTSSGSWPSHSKVAQPQAAKRATWSVVSARLTGPSMVMPLSSNRTVSLRSRCIPARAMASWLTPSIRQPSPAIT